MITDKKILRFYYLASKKKEKCPSKEYGGQVKMSVQVEVQLAPKIKRNY